MVGRRVPSTGAHDEVGAVRGEQYGAEHRGAVAELGQHDGGRGGVGEHVAAQAHPDRLEQRLAGPGQVATDHDDAGVEQVDDRRETPAQVHAGVLEQPRCGDVAGPGRLEDVIDRGVGQLGAHHLRDAVGGGVRLEAAAAPAPADRALLVDGEVPDLARGAACAVQDLAVHDQTGTDTGGHLDVDDLVLAAGGTDEVLGESAEVGVVVDVDGSFEAFLGDALGVDPDPAREDGRGPHDVIADRGRQAHADGADLVPAVPGFGQGLVEQGVGELEAVLVAMVVREALPLLDQRLAGQVGDRYREVAVADVDADDQAGRARQPDHRAPASTARLGLDQARGGERPDDVGDGAGGQSGDSRELRLGDRLLRAAAEYVDDAALVGRPQRGGRAGRMRLAPAARRRHGGHCAAGHTLSSSVERYEGLHHRLESFAFNS